MKKCLFALVGLLSLFGFIACNMGNNTETDEEKRNNQKKELLSQLVGTNWVGPKENDFTNVMNIRDDSVPFFSVFSISGYRDNFFIYDTNVSPWYEDVLFDSELPENSELENYYNNKLNSSLCFIDVDYYNNKRYGGYRTIYKFEWNKQNKDFFTKGDILYVYFEKIYNPEYNSDIDVHKEYTYTFSSYRDGYGPQDNNSDNTSDDNSTTDASTYIGSYAFDNATGSQQNGTVTLKDGNWSYSGDKSNPAASSGTYTVNGSKVTLNWTAAGNNVSETFTISTLDNSSTWTSEYSGTSLLFSMLFGVVSTEMTFTYSE